MYSSFISRSHFSPKNYVDHVDYGSLIDQVRLPESDKTDLLTALVTNVRGGTVGGFTTVFFLLFFNFFNFFSISSVSTWEPVRETNRNASSF